MRLTRGSFRELHWHTADEWAIMLDGNARVTVAYVPAVAGHYIENTGDIDLVFLEMFQADRYIDFSMNNWLRRLPPEMVTAHLKIPAEKQVVIAA